MSSSKVVCFFLLLLVTFNLRAFEYVVGVEDVEYYPYWADRDGHYAGFARKLLDRFAESKGYHFVYQPLPVKRLWNTYFSGQVDLKFPDNPHWAKMRKSGYNIVYSQPAVNYIDGVMVLPGHKGLGLERLERLGTIRGTTILTRSNGVKYVLMNSQSLIS